MDDELIKTLWVEIQLFGEKHGHISKEDILGIVAPHCSEFIREMVADEYLAAIKETGLISMKTEGVK